MRFEYLDSDVPMTVIGGHMGGFTAAALGDAIHYLDRLQDAVVRIRADAPLQQVDERIGSITLETCLAPRVRAVAFERRWHRHNREVVLAQSIFALDAALVMQAGNA